MKKNLQKLSKGFTIVELLVVIAIIAVLAAIVLVNVTQYIAKAKRAAEEGNLATLLTNAAVFYDANTTYVAFHSDPTFTNPTNAIIGSSGPESTATMGYAETSTAWCACAPLTDITGDSGEYYCVDSTGNKKKTTTACQSSAEITACTAGHACSATASADECSTASSTPEVCL